jgi:hypothetical protein
MAPVCAGTSTIGLRPHHGVYEGMGMFLSWSKFTEQSLGLPNVGKVMVFAKPAMDLG